MSDAPTLEPGTYDLQILTGETRVFAVPLAWGERLQAEAVVAPRRGALPRPWPAPPTWRCGCSTRCAPRSRPCSTSRARHGRRTPFQFFQDSEPYRGGRGHPARRLRQPRRAGDRVLLAPRPAVRGVSATEGARSRATPTCSPTSSGSRPSRTGTARLRRTPVTCPHPRFPPQRSWRAHVGDVDQPEPETEPTQESAPTAADDDGQGLSRSTLALGLLVGGLLTVGAILAMRRRSSR
jgi:hypothetical protein